MTDKMIWLWLSLHFGAGKKIYKKLYNHFESVNDIFECDDDDVALIPGIMDAERDKLLDKNTKEAELIYKWCERFDVKILTPSDDEYPQPLRLLEDFPAVLYCIGNLPDFQNKLCISVVGTRNMSITGMNNAYELGYGLTKGGAFVISGMAKGIDTTAQKGAMFAGGSTIAVLGCGINYIYPAENDEVYKKILAVGAAITEYPPNTPPNASNFPVRNRLISGLSSAVVVVEAGTNSGALITARRAQEQDKKIFAYPGDVNDFRSDGSNQLIKDGAQAITSAIDVLEQFMDTYKDTIDLSASKLKPNKKDRSSVSNKRYEFKEDFLYERRKSKRKDGRILEPINKPQRVIFDSSVLNDDEKLVYDFMKPGIPLNVNGFKDLNMDSGTLVSCLGTLELLGVVTVVNGYYTRK